MRPNNKSNITKITSSPHQNIPTIPHRHLTITLTQNSHSLRVRRLEPPLKTCTSIHYQNHTHMRPKQLIKYHKNNTTPASKHPNHTTPPSYYYTHKTSPSRRACTSREPPPKHALQYTIKITRACVQTTNQISQNNTTRLASKHPNHTTPPSYYYTHKTSQSVSPRLVNIPSKYALQYTIKITRACVKTTNQISQK